MTRRNLLLFTLAAALPLTAQDKELHIICSNVIRGAMEQLIPQFERSTGRHVIVHWGASIELKKGIESGEAFDVALLTTGILNGLAKSGSIAPESQHNIAQANLGVGMRSGGAKTDIGSAAAMKQRLLAAKSITYSKDGGGVAAIQSMLSRLGIAAELQARIVQQEVAGRAAESVAQGENELAFAPVTEIVAVPGVEVLGLFPAEFQSPLAITSGISSKTRLPKYAEEFAHFVVNPNSLKVIEASGMELSKK